MVLITPHAAIGTDVDKDAGCVTELDRMIRLAEGNNGIVNYWLR